VPTLFISRGWVKEFFLLAIRVFDIGIWSAADMGTTLSMVSSIFSAKLVKKFQFVKSSLHVPRSDSCWVRRDRARKKIHFKSLALVWAEIQAYDESNTVLIDCRTYHGWTNPSDTLLCVPKFDSRRNDMFLKDYLWPCLCMLATACHTRVFLNVSEPKWSRQAAHDDMKIDNGVVHAYLNKHFSHRRGKRREIIEQFSALE
jgi:hypothetical protein